MSDQSGNHKDVFAHFGLAAYHAQCFEMELKNIFILLLRANNRTWPISLLEQCETVLDKQTLGTLLRDIRNVVAFDDGCVAAVESALATRNRLMHGYYERHAADLLSDEGRGRMIRELEEYQQSFVTADAIARSVSGALGKALGITNEMLESELQRMTKEAAERDQKTG